MVAGVTRRFFLRVGRWLRVAARRLEYIGGRCHERATRPDPIHGDVLIARLKRVQLRKDRLVQ